MTKNKLARIMYRSYSSAAFGRRAMKFDRLRPHEKKWWLETAEDVLSALESASYKAEQQQDRFFQGGV